MSSLGNSSGAPDDDAATAAEVVVVATVVDPACPIMVALESIDVWSKVTNFLGTSDNVRGVALTCKTAEQCTDAIYSQAFEWARQNCIPDVYQETFLQNMETSEQNYQQQNNSCSRPSFRWKFRMMREIPVFTIQNPILDGK
ncbi:MAG: hypothetical protein SGILL_006221, partial [Bacillariaceae sp.]